MRRRNATGDPSGGLASARRPKGEPLASEMGRWVSSMTKKGSLQASVRDGCRGRSWRELRQRRCLIVPGGHLPRTSRATLLQRRFARVTTQKRAARHEMNAACRASPIGVSPPLHLPELPHPPHQELGRLPTSFICFISAGSGTHHREKSPCQRKPRRPFLAPRSFFRFSSMLS